MSQTSQEVTRQDCGCAETTTRDVSGKVVAQDLNHCIAHALEWAGKFLQHAGRRLITETIQPDPETQKFSAVYGNNLGALLWSEEEYPHPKPHAEGEAILHDDRAYRITKAVTIGLRHVFTVEEADPADVRDAVVDHLKKHGLKEPKTDAPDS